MLRALHILALSYLAERDTNSNEKYPFYSHFDINYTEASVLYIFLKYIVSSDRFGNKRVEI